MTAPLNSETRQRHFILPFDHPAPGTAAAAVRATGTITCVANGSMADSDYMTITDPFYGTGAGVLYEYDKAANGVTGGRVSWAAGTTAASIAATLKTAIEANQPQFTVTDNLDGTLTLSYKIAGLAGNLVAMTENVANGGFLVSANLAGGADAATTGATLVTKLTKVSGLRLHVDRVEYINPTGLAGHGSNYWEIALKNGSDVIAQWSTDSDVAGQGTITANTPIDLVLATDHSLLALDSGETLSLALTKFASAANLPAGRIVVHGRYV